MEVGLSESVDDSLSTADSIISQVTTLMKTKYNLDVLGNKMTPESYAALSTAEKIRLNEDIQGVFDEEFPLTVVNDFFSIFNLTVDLFDSIESYVEYLYTGASLMAMSDATLAALQEMYPAVPRLQLYHAAGSSGLHPDYELQRGRIDCRCGCARAAIGGLAGCHLFGG